MTNDITILSCPQCGFPRIRDCGNGLYQCDDCGTHFDKDENIVLTEQEYLQTCDTEQLAEEIYGFVWCCNELWQRLCCSGDGTDKESDLKVVIEWLKQPHNSSK